VRKPFRCRSRNLQTVCRLTLWWQVCQFLQLSGYESSVLGSGKKFVLEWADSFALTHMVVLIAAVVLATSGRDVVAFDTSDNTVWDNYQCKHYKDALTPSAIWG